MSSWILLVYTGALLEQYGTYEPNGMAFADAGEVWWLETIGGHHWIARRVPDDRVVIMPNQFGLDHFDFADAYGEQKEHLCSQDLREFVEKYRISGQFVEKSFEKLNRWGRYSGGLGIILTATNFFDDDSSWEKVAVDEIFNIIGFFSLPGFIISTTYTAVDVFYPNGWKGLFDDISKHLYEMYMNQVNEDGVMMAPWIFGK